MSFAGKLAQAERRAQRPYNFRGPSGGGFFGGGRPPIPAALRYPGCVGWWDAAHSGVTADGATVTAPLNRVVGSNAVMAPSPGSAATTLIAATNANGWNSKIPSPCWNLQNSALRATGSDVVNAMTGTGKAPMYLLGWCPRLTTNTIQYACGWDNEAAASFSNAALITRCFLPSSAFKWSVFGPGAAETADTQTFSQNVEVLEISRPGGNQVQFGINQVRTAPVAWQSGTAFNVDGFSVGGWAGNNTANAQGDAWIQFVQVFATIPSPTALAAVYAYNAQVYSGYEMIGSLNP